MKSLGPGAANTDEALRILLVGPINSPHIIHPALALAERGHIVHVAGDCLSNVPLHDLEDTRIGVTELTPRPSRVPGLRAVRRIRQLRQIIRDVRPDVVHAHYVWYWGFFALAAGARPLAVSAWGSDILRADRQAQILNRLVLRRADLVIAVSPDLKRRTQRLGAAPDRTHIVQGGVDLDRFTAPTEPREAIRARLGLGPGPLVLSPRELLPLYNPEVIAAAFTRVLDAVPDAQLVFKHQRSEHPDLGPLPQPSRVHFVGGGPHEQMADYYRAADVCVSIPSTDGSPRSVSEAMACGCPCVLSDLPWLKDLIVAGRHALVVPPDAVSVGNAITRLLVEPSLGAAVGNAGRELCLAHWDREVQLDHLESLYKTVVHASTGSTPSR